MTTRTRDGFGRFQDESDKLDSRVRAVWRNMVFRCTNPRSAAFKDYGARGITVCERWLDCRTFVEDMGECPSGATVERIDNDGPYSPENCRWATRVEQGRNKRNNVVLDVDGIRKTLVEWSEIYGVRKATIRMRLRIGWSASDAVKTPRVTRRINVPHGVPIHQHQPDPEFESALRNAVPGLSYVQIQRRLNRGWSIERATSAPSRPYRKNSEHGIVFHDQEREEHAA